MTLPRFDFNDFPIETDQPRIEVTLPVGRHVLELVVEDSAGLRSAPSTVVVTVDQSPPVINQLQPNTGTQGSTVRAEIQGENLLGISQVSFSGTGVSTSILPGGTNDIVPVEITIAPTATLGGHSFTVTTPGGTATSPSSAQFTVQQNAPVIQGINPAGGTQGTQSLQVTITGQNLAGAQDVTFSGTGVTLNRIVSSTASSVVADIAIAANARPDARSFTVTTPGGRGSSPAGLSFTVQQAVPVVTGINPSSSAPGSRVTATISGSNLLGATRVVFSGSGVTVDRISGSSDTSVSVNLTIDANAALGPRSFTVTTPGGDARSPANVSFDIQQAAPVITGITPASGPENTRSFRLTISGQNLAGVRELEFSTPDISMNQIVSSNISSVVADIAIISGASPGPHSFLVRGPGGEARSPGGVGFSVQQAAPTITAINPAGGLVGNTVDAAIAGTNLSSASGVAFSGTGVTARILRASTDREVAVSIAIGSTAATGTRTFTVQTSSGRANSADSQVTFSVISITIPTLGPFPTIGPIVTPIIPTTSPTIRPIIGTVTTSPTLTNLTNLTRLTTASRLGAAPTNTQPVDEVSGIGPTFRSRLEAGGINTISDLANAQPAEVARLLGTTEVRAMSFIDAARQLGG